MAQLAAGMLPLHQQAPVTRPQALRPRTPRPISEATVPKVTVGAVSLLHTSPITSEDEIPALVDPKEPGAEQPIDLTIKQEPKEEKTEIPTPPTAQTAHAENKDEFVPHIKEISSIPLSLSNSMDRDGMPEVSHMVAKENPRSPTPTRMEEEMDTSPPPKKRTQVKICLKPQPVHPEITVMQASDDYTSTDEETAIQEKAQAFYKRRERTARRKGIFLKINPMRVGPNNLEICYQKPPTPMEAPEPLFPGSPKTVNED